MLYLGGQVPWVVDQEGRPISCPANGDVPLRDAGNRLRSTAAKWQQLSFSISLGRGRLPSVRRNHPLGGTNSFRADRCRLIALHALHPQSQAPVLFIPDEYITLAVGQPMRPQQGDTAMCQLAAFARPGGQQHASKGDPRLAGQYPLLVRRKGRASAAAQA